MSPRCLAPPRCVAPLLPCPLPSLREPSPPPDRNPHPGALIACGAAQSNHARQTAAAAAKFRLHRVLVLRGDEPDEIQGNLVLDHLPGAEIVWAVDHPPDQLTETVAHRLSEEGRRPYVVPHGGSNPAGVSGYVAAMEELAAQCNHRDISFDHVVLASSNGGTQAGLAVAARATQFPPPRILGISVDLPAHRLRAILAELATTTAAHLDLELALGPVDFHVSDDYLGRGYGVISDLERDAIDTLAQTEGLLLDLIRRGAFHPGDNVLFWHTGGTAALFGKRDVLNSG